MSERDDESKVVYSAEFDCYESRACRIDIRESAGLDELVICMNGQEVTLVIANRDQWGVFLSVGGSCIAQEDGTRSFIDALIGSLQQIRVRNEIETLPATVVELA